MVQIVFIRQGDKLGMTARGHAGYAEMGKDIVCAAASMLVYTLGQYILWLRTNSKLAEEPVLSFVSGDADISFTPKPEFRQEGIIALQVIEQGAACLEANYPEYIRIHKVGYAEDGDQI